MSIIGNYKKKGIDQDHDHKMMEMENPLTNQILVACTYFELLFLLYSVLFSLSRFITFHMLIIVRKYNEYNN